jgi:serine/threonine protein phosphatase PrpC
MDLQLGTATHVGLVRDHNEDAGLAQGGLYLVADGMGGHAAGEVASGIVVEAMTELVSREQRSPEDVVGQLMEANDRILGSASTHPERSGMGTTVTGIALVTVDGADRWLIFNIGDSRVYRYADERLSLVTRDHSEVREMVDAGLITAEQALHHPLRNIVTRSLGMPGTPDIDTWVVPPCEGERFLICSDGLSGEVTPEGIGTILDGYDDPQEAADALVSAALESGGSDNVTVIVVDVVRGEDGTGIDENG